MPLVRSDVGIHGLVTDGQRLARYQALHKLKFLLSTGTLRLGSLASYVDMDPLEGALPEWAYYHRIVKSLDQLHPDIQAEMRAREIYPARRALGDPYRLTMWKQQREEEIAQIRTIMAFTFINCWCRAETESWMMWNSYARDGAPAEEQNRGVALITNPARIRSTLAGVPGNFQLGYVHYLKNGEQSDQNHGQVVTSKRYEFRHEEEVRLALFLDEGFQMILHVPFPDPDTIPNADNIIPLIRTQPPQFVAVDFNKLIGEVLVHPAATSDDVEAVKAVVDQYGLQAPVRKSVLLKPGSIPPVA